MHKDEKYESEGGAIANQERTDFGERKLVVFTLRIVWDALFVSSAQVYWLLFNK